MICNVQTCRTHPPTVGFSGQLFLPFLESFFYGMIPLYGSFYFTVFFFSCGFWPREREKEREREREQERERERERERATPTETLRQRGQRRSGAETLTERRRDAEIQQQLDTETERRVVRREPRSQLAARSQSVSE